MSAITKMTCPFNWEQVIHHLFALFTLSFFPLTVVSFMALRTRGPFPFKISTYEALSMIVMMPMSSADTPSILAIVPTKSTALIFFFFPPLKYSFMMSLFSSSLLSFLIFGRSFSLARKSGFFLRFPLGTGLLMSESQIRYSLLFQLGTAFQTAPQMKSLFPDSRLALSVLYGVRSFLSQEADHS